jgi:hypothetical protein
MMSTSPPCARTWAAGMDAVAVLPPPVPTAMKQVRFLVLQVRDPLPAAGQGGQVDLVGGQVVPVEPGQRPSRSSWAW